MKKLLLGIACMLYSITCKSQEATIVLQNDSVCGQDALVWNAPGFPNGNTNYGSHEALGAHAWTNQGTPDTARSLISFDLSGIPVGSTVTVATLSLYNNPTTVYAGGEHSSLSGPNSLFIQRVTSSWSESAVTWFTQPSTTTQNQVSVPASISNHQDYPAIDVTALVQDMVNNPSGSFGFMIRLQDETYYRAMVFASSDCTDPTKWPSLLVSFQPPPTACITLQPHNGCGKDAIVWNAPGFPNGNTNYGSHEALGAHAWTNQGTPDTARSLLEFDLSVLPGSITINSAMLSLYNNPTTQYAQGEHSWLSGANDGWLQRIITPWNEKTVTWMTQPTATTLNEVAIPASTSVHQDYLNIDVTQLVRDMYFNPASYGFLIRLNTEEYYRALVFASSNETNPLLNPRLDICYAVTSDIEKLTLSAISIFPNPASDYLTIESAMQQNSDLKIELFNAIGEKVKEVLLKKSNSRLTLPLAGLASGVYLIKLNGAEHFLVKKLIIQAR